jgi:hypothetical protein
MYNEICQYSSSVSTDSPSLILYGTAPMNRSFPYSIMAKSSNEMITFDQLNNKELLDTCREQCLKESNKALELLQKGFDQKSSATIFLRSIIEKIQAGVYSKTVL